MFERKHHQRIEEILNRFDSKILSDNECFFAGGTAIVLLLNEYRESVDIDFICASQDGYRELRNIITQKSLGDIVKGDVRYPREVKADRYGIRTFIEIDDVPVKLEIVREDRIEVSGEFHNSLPVEILSRTDMFAEKLLANADRGLDKSTMSRDIIDTAMMIQQWGAVPADAISKAEKAYGKSIRDYYGKAVELLNNKQYLENCLVKMQMDSSLLENIPEIFRNNPLPKLKSPRP